MMSTSTAALGAAPNDEMCDMSGDLENDTKFSDENPYASPAHYDPPSASPGRTLENDGLATARIAYTGDYLIEALIRYRAQRNGRIAWIVLRTIAILSFACFTVLAISQRHYLFGVFLAAFTVLLIVGQRIDNWRIKRALASSPHLNEELTLHLSDTDFHVWSAMQDTRLSWSLFSRAVYFDDGVLILQGPNLFHWIPWSALLAGTQPNRIESLLQTRISQHDDRRTNR
ncbi:MAG: YcxB family protein [Pirellulaceae bacterium]